MTKFYKEKIKVSELVKLQQEGKIDFNPPYQRGEAWDKKKRELAIDSMLKGYDIPKFYAKKNEAGVYEIIDGKQRGSTILDFHFEEFSLPALLINGESLAGITLTELNSELQKNFYNYELDFTIYDDISDEETINIFIRLQNGSPLNVQEKRFADHTKPIISFINDVCKHPLFTEKLDIPDKRGTHKQIATQLFAAYLSDGHDNITSPALTKFIKANEQVFKGDTQSVEFIEILDDLANQFGNQSDLLQRPMLVPLMLIVKDLSCEDNYKEKLDLLRPWVNDFLKEYREEKGRHRKSPTTVRAHWSKYIRACANHTDTSDSIEQRVKILKKSFYSYIEKYSQLNTTDPIIEEEVS